MATKRMSKVHIISDEDAQRVYGELTFRQVVYSGPGFDGHKRMFVIFEIDKPARFEVSVAGVPAQSFSDYNAAVEAYNDL